MPKILKTTSPVTTRHAALLPVIDLFAGVGGFSLGAARSGFDVIAAFDLDAHAIEAHAINFPESRHYRRNVMRLTGDSLLALAGLQKGELAGIIGGPPCQGFSAIGKKRKHDRRNRLFEKFVELVADSRPKFFVVENVPGILDARYDELRQSAFRKVSRIYRLIGPVLIKASDYGAATSRERVFYVGILPKWFNNITAESFATKRVALSTTVEAALRGLPESIRCDWQEQEQGWRQIMPLNGSRFERKIAGVIPKNVGDPIAIDLYRDAHLVSGCLGTRHSDETIARFKRVAPGGVDKISRFPRLKHDSFCPTLRAGTASDKGSYQAARPIHPFKPRVITPREAARLQGFPDWFQFAPSKWHSFRQIGNSVSPIVSEAVLSVIQKHLRTRPRPNRR